MSATTIKHKSPLANQLQEPRVTIVLDGKEWTLVVTTNVLCDLETETGTNVLFGAEATIGKLSMTLMRCLLWLCLREQGASYTLQQVGNLVNGKNLAEVIEKLLKAYTGSMPQKEDIEADMGELKAAV
jgi:hypothetical protein